MVKKNEIVSVVTTIEELYDLFSENFTDGFDFRNKLPIVAKICTKWHPFFKDNVVFVSLFNYVNQLLVSPYFSQKENESAQFDIETLNDTKNKFLLLLEQFELSLIEETKFEVFINNNMIKDIPLNQKFVKRVTDLTFNLNSQESFSKFQESEQDFTVLIHSGHLNKQEAIHSDFCFQTDGIIYSLNTMIDKIKNIDYYRRDKLYLEAKLESLKKRQDIRLLLAGSSYTMCGLFEEQMPLPARNVAIDAQDLYYTLKTIRTALSYNQNIKHCIVSFAYYFWGYDLSLSTSIYQYKRITNVNYPVFSDKHNFSGELVEGIDPYLTAITPLKRRLFAFDSLSEQYVQKIKKTLENSNYFPYPRVQSEVLKHDERTNQERAQKRAASHNKFFKYNETVQENLKLFDNFVEEMNTNGVQLILYVPPVTEYYRNNINHELISNFYSVMNLFLQKYSFKLIDLFNSEAFENGDFADYDHLNDRGARKLAEILAKELDI